MAPIVMAMYLPLFVFTSLCDCRSFHPEVYAYLSLRVFVTFTPREACSSQASRLFFIITRNNFRFLPYLDSAPTL
jgi:hypothetical protein